MIEACPCCYFSHEYGKGLDIISSDPNTNCVYRRKIRVKTVTLFTLFLSITHSDIVCDSNVDMDVIFKRVDMMSVKTRYDDLSFNEGLGIVLALNIVFMVSFWSVGLAFLYTDVTGRPRWMLKYKTQPGKNQPVAFIGLPYSVLHYILHKVRGSDLSYNMPPLHEMLLQMLVFVLVEEITFYYSHRFFHSSFMYKTVHKQHHEWTAPIGIGAVYAHPVEFALGNIWTVASGPLLVGSCQVTTFTWIALATAVTIIHHSGYHLPLLPSPEFHDYHHLKFTGNYGLLGILDRLHGTMNPQFLKSRQYRRHRIILSASQMK